MQINTATLVFLIILCLNSGLSLLQLQLKSKIIEGMRFISSTNVLNTRSEDAEWKRARAWCAVLETKPKRNIYLEVDLGKEYDITGIETMGWPTIKKKMRKYVLLYKRQGRWVAYRERLRIKVFKGDFCHSSNRPSSSSLKEPIIAQHLRVHPFSKKRETGCLKLRIYGTAPVQGDCARVGTYVMVKNTNDRPISYLPGQIEGFSKHHIYASVRNSRVTIRVNKEEDYALILDKKIKQGSLKINDKVLALFSRYDRYYESSVQYISNPPGYAFIQNEAFYSPSEWVKDRYLRSFHQAYLCYCSPCGVSSSLEGACDLLKSSFDFGYLVQTIQMTQENNKFHYLLGNVQNIFLNRKKPNIQKGKIQKFRFKPNIKNSCLCPHLKEETNYIIFGVVRNNELLIDSKSFVKEFSRTENLQNFCQLRKH